MSTDVLANDFADRKGIDRFTGCESRFCSAGPTEPESGSTGRGTGGVGVLWGLSGHGGLAGLEEAFGYGFGCRFRGDRRVLEFLSVWCG